MRIKQLHMRLLKINSNEKPILRRGRLLQFLVLLLLVMAIGRIMILLIDQMAFSESGESMGSLIAQLTAVLLFTTGCLWLIRQGRMRRASHLFSGGLSLMLFFLILGPRPIATAVPYLLLVPIVAIATLDSVRASHVYALLTGTAVVILFTLSDNFSWLDTGFYLITLIGVAVTVWVTAEELRTISQSTQALAADLQTKNELLRRRAQQLELSAEVGQMPSDTLDLQSLMRHMVAHIQTQFNLYHVSIFLADDPKQTLRLAEATGEIGKGLMARGYRLPLDETSIIGWVALHKEARISQDVSDDPFYHQEPLLPETQSELCLPLLVRGELRGVLDIQSRRATAFQTEDIAILQVLANQVAVSIDNSQLLAQTATRLNETKILYDLNTLLTTTMDVGEIYRRAAREFTIKLDGASCDIDSWNPTEQLLINQSTFVHENEGRLVDAYLTTYRTTAVSRHPDLATILKTHAPRVFAHDDPLPPLLQDQLQSEAPHAALQLPLVYGVDALGLVTLYRDSTRAPFTAREIQLAQTMANQTAVALNNATVTSNARGQVAQFSSLLRLSNTLTQAPTLKAVFSGARREILSLVEASGMSISLLTQNGKMLDWVYGYEFGQEVDLSNIPLLPITEGFSGHVARTREVFYTDKAGEQRDEFDSVTVGAELGYWLGLPMIVANELIGVLAVEHERPFSNHEIELLKTMVGPMAIAIKNLIQFDEVQRALKTQSRQRIQIQTAAEVAATATSVLDLDELMQKSVDLIKERFQLYYVGLFLIHPDTHDAVLQAGTGEAGRIQIENGHRLPVSGRSLIGGATADGVPRIIQDVTENDEWRPNPHLPDTRSELALPLRVRERVIGALTVQSRNPNVFDEELIGTLLTMTDQLAVAIENAQLLARTSSAAFDQQQLNEIGRQLHQLVDVDQILSLGLKAIANRVGSQEEVKIVLGRQANGKQAATGADAKGRPT